MMGGLVLIRGRRRCCGGRAELDQGFSCLPRSEWRARVRSRLSGGGGTMGASRSLAERISSFVPLCVQTWAMRSLAR